MSHWSVEVGGLILTCKYGCDIEGYCLKSDSMHSNFFGIWVGDEQLTNKRTKGIWPMKKYKGVWIFILWKPYTPYAKAPEVTAISKCHTGVFECKWLRCGYKIF